jgi:glutamate racemase
VTGRPHRARCAHDHRAPIGVFDSGVGGLTVLRALLAAFPHEHFIYLGDTARLPYGTKSADSIRHYAYQAAATLQRRGVKCLVVACNTASAVAIDVLTDEFAPVPVLGVLEPGAAAACVATRSGRIAVLATESTVRGGAYQAAIAQRLPRAIVSARACPLFVAFAEEGWTEGPVVEAVAHHYLDELFAAGEPDAHPDTLLLGCTHFPVLEQGIRAVAGLQTTIVDSAATTAKALERALADAGLAGAPGERGRVEFLATDDAERFARVGSTFLGRSLAAGDVEIVDLRGNAAAAATSRK